MRNTKDSTLGKPLIHPSTCIRNDAVMNEEDDEVERRSLPTKQIKISIKLSFHDIVSLCISLYSVDVLCMFEICIYTTELHMMGKKSMMLYNIPFI